MSEPITNILDVRLPQPNTEEWRKLPAPTRETAEILLDLRDVCGGSDTLVAEVDGKLLELLIPHALQEECGPAG